MKINNGVKDNFFEVNSKLFERITALFALKYTEIQNIMPGGTKNVSEIDLNRKHWTLKGNCRVVIINAFSEILIKILFRFTHYQSSYSYYHPI